MKTAVVTGSTKGIGLAIGMELLRRGCEVAFHYHRDAESAERLKNELTLLDLLESIRLYRRICPLLRGCRCLGMLWNHAFTSWTILC